MKRAALGSSLSVMAIVLGLAVAAPSHAQDTSTPSDSMSSETKGHDHHKAMAECENKTGADKDACMKKVKEQQKEEKHQKGKKGYDPCAPGGQQKAPANEEPCAKTPKQE